MPKMQLISRQLVKTMKTIQMSELKAIIENVGKYFFLSFAFRLNSLAATVDAFSPLVGREG